MLICHNKLPFGHYVRSFYLPAGKIPPTEELPALLAILRVYASSAPNVTQLTVGRKMSKCLFTRDHEASESNDLNFIFTHLPALWPRLIGLHDLLCDTTYLDGQLFTDTIVGLSQLQRLSLTRQAPGQQACFTNTLKIRATLCKQLPDLYRPIQVLELANFPSTDGAFLVSLLTELPALVRYASLASTVHPSSDDSYYLQLHPCPYYRQYRYVPRRLSTRAAGLPSCCNHASLRHTAARWHRPSVDSAV